MVASGLSERVEVSQYRLALHLLIGTATFGALLWGAVGLRQRPREPVSRRFAAFSGAIAILVFCQIGFGALVAGLRAGLIFNTWPLMDGRLIPSGLFAQSPWWRNLFEDVTTVQFQHRLLAYIVVLLALWQAIAAARAAPLTALARRAAAVGLLALSQAALGVLALLLVVPIWAGLACCTRLSRCCCSAWLSRIGARRAWNKRWPCMAGAVAPANLLNVARFHQTVLMTKPAPDSSYNRDFYAWANEQAALLRAGKFGEVDFEHVAEEIESMARPKSANLPVALPSCCCISSNGVSNPNCAARAGASVSKSSACRSPAIWPTIRA
jgi:hypothetical protein